MANTVVSVLAVLAAALPLATADTGPFIFRKRQSTCASSVESCGTAATAASTCCVNKPGGQLLQVQFWDTDPVEGPSNSWGIHGLWPDNCDGTYDEECDTTREYTDITTLIEKYGTTELLDDMNTYWNSYDETNEEFWEHEWYEHGTCVSTLDPSCYADYETGMEAVDFFQITVNLFKSLDTYQVLYDAGIVPSSSATYTSSEITKAISASFGQDPVLICSSSTLSSIYYGFFVNGPLLNEDFVPAAIVGDSSTCPSSGIKYPPKVGATTTVATGTATSTSKPTTTTTASECKITKLCTTSTSVPTTTTTSKTTSTSSAATGTGTSISGSGYWYAYYNGAQDGCLISGGTWYTSGTCATYKATASGTGFTLTTSKGNCGVVDDQITCGSGVSLTTFSAIGGYLAYNGVTTFYSTEIPSGSEQADVWTDYGSYSVTFKWSAV